MTVDPSHSTPSLRDATPDDCAAIAEIYNESLVAGDATMDEGLKDSDHFRNVLAGLDEREVCLVLAGGREVLGWGLLKRSSERPGYRFAGETRIFLRRNRVGRGYGSRIKRALIERSRVLSYHHLVAKIQADNTLSIEYNKKFGYELVGIQKEIGYRDGRWRDVAILQLVFDGPPPSLEPARTASPG